MYRVHNVLSTFLCPFPLMTNFNLLSGINIVVISVQTNLCAILDFCKSAIALWVCMLYSQVHSTTAFLMSERHITGAPKETLIPKD